MAFGRYGILGRVDLYVVKEEYGIYRELWNAELNDPYHLGQISDCSPPFTITSPILQTPCHEHQAPSTKSL